LKCLQSLHVSQDHILELSSASKKILLGIFQVDDWSSRSLFQVKNPTRRLFITWIDFMFI